MPTTVWPDNRAYQRFLALASDHFEVAEWKRDRDDQPVMLSLTDLHSGDCITLALLDSEEDTQPHVLAVFDPQGQMSAYGPFEGLTTAERYAPELAAADDDVATTKAMQLLSPDVTAIPADAWIEMPPHIATTVHPAPATGATAIILVIDRQQRRCCVVGPFPTPASAAEWILPADVDAGKERLLTPVHPPRSAS